MKAIIIENKIRLVSNEFESIRVNVICPARNIQKMEEETGCIILSKKETVLNYNHHAGTVYAITISVQFNRIEKYLNTKNVRDCENKANYFDLLSAENCGFYDSEVNLKANEITGLYIFGDCSKYTNTKLACFPYYAPGKKVKYFNSNKRYYKNCDTWYSNKKY